MGRCPTMEWGKGRCPGGRRFGGRRSKGGYFGAGPRLGCLKPACSTTGYANEIYAGFYSGTVSLDKLDERDLAQACIICA